MWSQEISRSAVGRAVFFLLGLTVIATLDASAQNRVGSDCSRYFGPLTNVNGQQIGPLTCHGSESPVRNIDGVPYRRVEMAISGILEGFTLNDGSRYSLFFTDVPEYALAQRHAHGPYLHGTARYYAEKGSGMTIFLPQSPADWNGKLFFLTHGSGAYSRVGELPPRDPKRYSRLMGANAYVPLLIDKGYAVAYTRRGAGSGKVPPGSKAKFQPGGETLTLDDGTVLTGKVIDYHMGWVHDFAHIAKSFVEAEMGRKPTRTYCYGKSAGGALGRLVNYVPGANVINGERIFDGMLIDDAGGGLYMPALQFARKDLGKGSFSVAPQAQDQLRFSDEHRRNFAYQIEIGHQAYAGTDYVLGDYISNKRQNARLLIQKGLGDKVRMYEIAGVSHADAGYASNGDPQASINNLDLSGTFDALIDVLDAWADQVVEPPPTRSDAYDLGDLDRDGKIENPAVALPEMACPTGVYHEFFKEGANGGQTGFVPYLRESRPPVNADAEPLPEGFDAAWLEPLDSRGYVLDMNRNTVRDTRDSIEQAWVRRWTEGKKHGVLRPGEALTHSRYIGCVASAATELVQQRLLSEPAMLDYIRGALDSDIGLMEDEAKDDVRVAAPGSRRR